MILTGLAVGLDSLPNLDFSPHKPYRACLICGAVYQKPNDREITPDSPFNLRMAADRRRSLWAVEHSKSHSDKEHKLLRISGMIMTAEAAYKLAAYGLIDAVGAVMNDEISSALAEAPSVPTSDAYTA